MYKPFPIYDFASGLRLDRDPWLLAKDAFKTMQNVRLRRGVLEKRMGYTNLTRLQNLDTSYPDLPVHGVMGYFNSAGVQELLFANSRRVFKYVPATQTVLDLTGSNIMDASSDNIINYENWRDSMFFVNGSDPLFEYDGTTVAELVVDTTNNGTTNLDTCLIVVVYYSRLLILRTYEDGDHHPQRARWSDLNNFNDWYTNGGYVDAPTNDWIIGADFIADDLVVFFENSTWALKYTGDANLPYRWEKISASDGAFSPYSLAQRRNKIMAISKTKIVVTDGLETVDFDQQIPDQVLAMNQSLTQEAVAVIVDEVHEIWWAYASIDSEKNDSILVYDYDDSTWAKFNLGMKSFGQYAIQDDPTWDNTDLPWNDIEEAWDSSTLQAGFPLTLAGDYDGYIHIMNSSGSDNETAIEAILETGQLNPWGPEGYEAWLGYIDILADSDDEIILTLEFCLDGETVPHTTKTTDLIGNGTKVWKRVYVNAVGEFHTIKIKQEDLGMQFRIHALVPYMKKGGKLI